MYYCFGFFAGFKNIASGKMKENTSLLKRSRATFLSYVRKTQKVYGTLFEQGLFFPLPFSLCVILKFSRVQGQQVKARFRRDTARCLLSKNTRSHLCVELLLYASKPPAQASFCSERQDSLSYWKCVVRFKLRADEQSGFSFFILHNLCASLTYPILT